MNGYGGTYLKKRPKTSAVTRIPASAPAINWGISCLRRCMRAQATRGKARKLASAAPPKTKTSAVENPPTPAMCMLIFQKVETVNIKIARQK